MVLLLCETTYGLSEVAAVVGGRVKARAAEVGVVSVAATVDSTRPIVAVGRLTAERARVDAAPAHKEQRSSTDFVKAT